MNQIVMPSQVVNLMEQYDDILYLDSFEEDLQNYLATRSKPVIIDLPGATNLQRQLDAIGDLARSVSQTYNVELITKVITVDRDCYQAAIGLREDIDSYEDF